MAERDLLKSFTDMLKDHFLIEQGGTDRIRAFYLKHKDRQIYGRMQSTYFLFTPEGIIITGDLCPGNDNRNSGVHAFGYNFDWFVSRLSEDYICSKFLDESWHEELAGEWCHEKADEITRGIRDDEFGTLTEARHKRRMLLYEAVEFRHSTKVQVETEPLSAEVSTLAMGDWLELKAKLKNLRTEHRRLRQELADEYHMLGEYMESGEEGIHHFRDELYRLERFEASDGLPGYDYNPRSKYLLIALQKKFADCYWSNKEKAKTSIGSVDLSEILPGGIIV